MMIINRGVESSISSGRQFRSANHAIDQDVLSTMNELLASMESNEG